MIPHYIWQAMDKWFILAEEGEQQWDGLDWAFMYTDDISVEAVLV